MKKLMRLLNTELSFFLVAPALVWQLFFLYLPILVIVCLSFIAASGQTSNFLFTLHNYSELLHPIYALILGRSLLLAFSTTLLCLLWAYPIAYFLAMQARSSKQFLLLLLILPFWTSFLVQVYAWFFILEDNGVLNSFLQKLHIINKPLPIMNSVWAVHIVMLCCYVPFMVMPIYTSLSKINKELLEASSDLGADQWYTFWHVIWPLSLSGVRTGFFLVFVPSFGEFVVPALMGGGKLMYVGSLIFYYFVETRAMPLGAAFTCISGIILLAVAIFAIMIFRRLSGSAKMG